jgi:tetratricopeptide (TPR) repeat protein
MNIRTISVARWCAGLLILIVSVQFLQAQPRPRRGTNRLQTVNRLLNKGQVDAAKREIQLLLKRDPENLVVHEYLALIHLKREDYSGARKEVDWILAKNPKSSRALMVLGRILVKEKKPLAAQNAFLRAYKTSDSTDEKTQLLQDLKEIRLSSAQVVRNEGATRRRSRPLTTPTTVDSQPISSGKVQIHRCPRIAVFPPRAAGFQANPMRGLKLWVPVA